MGIDEKLNYLVRKKYNDAKHWFLDNKQHRKVEKILLTNDGKYIFVCKA